MKFSKSNLIILISIIGLGLVAVGSFYIYNSVFKVEKNKIKENVNPKEVDKIEVQSVFPNIDDSYYQEFLIKNNFGNSKIDDKLVITFIKDILKRMAVSYGSISFKSEIAENKIVITLQWQHNEKFEVKKYTFQIKTI